MSVLLVIARIIVGTTFAIAGYILARRLVSWLGGEGKFKGGRWAHFFSSVGELVVLFIVIAAFGLSHALWGVIEEMLR